MIYYLKIPTLQTRMLKIYIPFPKEINRGFVITYVPRKDYLLKLNDYYTKTRDNFAMMMGQILLNDMLENRKLLRESL